MRNGTRDRVGIAAIVVLLVSLSLSSLADSDCWCAQYVDLEADVPTRTTNVFLRLGASVLLTGATLWGVDAVGLPHADWYKVGAIVAGASNVAHALNDLLLPTERSVEKDADRIAESTLSEDLCRGTLEDYLQAVRAHRLINGGINLASGAAQLLLLSPYGRYATGEIYDYVYLVTGGIDTLGGLFNVLFPTRFERLFGEAAAACLP